VIAVVLGAFLGGVYVGIARSSPDPNYNDQLRYCFHLTVQRGQIPPPFNQFIPAGDNGTYHVYICRAAVQ
jgi:hypothetical protein